MVLPSPSRGLEMQSVRLALIKNLSMSSETKHVYAMQRTRSLLLHGVPLRHNVITAVFRFRSNPRTRNSSNSTQQIEYLFVTACDEYSVYYRIIKCYSRTASDFKF